MPKRQTDHLMSKEGDLSKFAANIFAAQRANRHQIGMKGAVLRALLNRVADRAAIDLESAAFMFHMTTTTQGITGSLRAACSEAVQTVSGLPSSS